MLSLAIFFGLAFAERPECDVCNGQKDKPQQLTLQWNGSGDVTFSSSSTCVRQTRLVAKSKQSSVVLDAVSCFGRGYKLPTNIYFNVDGSSGYLHASCSQPLNLGDVVYKNTKGELSVVGFQAVSGRTQTSCAGYEKRRLAGPTPVLRRLTPERTRRGGQPSGTTNDDTTNDDCTDNIMSVISGGEQIYADIETSDWTAGLTDAIDLYNVASNTLTTCEHCIEDPENVYGDLKQLLSDAEALDWSSVVSDVETVLSFFNQVKSDCVGR